MKKWPALIVVILILAGGAAGTRLGGSSTETHEIVLVARRMAFLSPDGTINPTLVVKKGERVRLTLRHDDPGFTHDFAVKSLGVVVEPLRNAGTSRSVVFRVPGKTGRHEYICNPHAKMMKGIVEIR